MPPKQRVGPVSKQCEECGGQNPVACKICESKSLQPFSNALKCIFISVLSFFKFPFF